MRGFVALAVDKPAGVRRVTRRRGGGVPNRSKRRWFVKYLLVRPDAACRITGDKSKTVGFLYTFVEDPGFHFR